MTEITIIDELYDLSKELLELIKEDWEKFKKFFKKNKKYMFWIFLLFITMQFTDIMNLGKSWDTYCKNNKNYINQLGGGENAVAPADPATSASADAKAAKFSKKQITKQEKKQSKLQKAYKAQGKPGLLSKSKKGLVDSIKNNPVLGNLDKIAGATSGLFTIILFILVVIGILSLPVLILIVITYTIIKHLLSKLSIL